MSGERRRARLRALLKAAGAADVDPALFEQAFVHESASREGAGASNERLEFYGDAILGFLAARWLIERYPDASEGELTRRKAALVSGEACEKTARRLGFGELVVLGEGMQRSGGAQNGSILADTFEAFIATLARGADRRAGTPSSQRQGRERRRRREDRAAGVRTGRAARRADVLRTRRGTGARASLHLAGARRRRDPR